MKAEESMMAIAAKIKRLEGAFAVAEERAYREVMMSAFDDALEAARRALDAHRELERELLAELEEHACIEAPMLMTRRLLAEVARE